MGESINLVNNFKIKEVIFNNNEYNELEKKLIEELEKKKIRYHRKINNLKIGNYDFNFLNNNIYKILIFAIGSLIGSYIGSILEEKIALGNNMLFIISKEYKKISKLENTYLINKDILIIMVKRKKRKEIIDKILNIDNKAIIISESAKQLVFK